MVAIVSVAGFGLDLLGGHYPAYERVLHFNPKDLNIEMETEMPPLDRGVMSSGGGIR